MQPVIPFKTDDFAIRVIDIEGEPWFVGKDIAEALGYSDTVNAIKLHCRGVVKHHPISDSLGRKQNTRLINEPDLFRLVVNSQLPAAEQFEQWVFEEVLPTIRKTGGYQIKRRAAPDEFARALKLMPCRGQVFPYRFCIGCFSVFVGRFRSPLVNGSPRSSVAFGCYRTPQCSG